MGPIFYSLKAAPAATEEFAKQISKCFLVAKKDLSNGTTQGYLQWSFFNLFSGLVIRPKQGIIG